MFIILYIKEYGDKNNFYLINIDECGDNILKDIFNVVKDTNIGLFIQHDIIEMPEEFDYFVNDEKLTDILSFGDFIE